LLALSAIAGCDRAGAGTAPAVRGVSTDSGPAAAETGCGDGQARPAPGAPAEGIWLYDGGGEHRVAAIVGPPQTVAGRARVTRRVETVEARPGADTIRYTSDTAAVRVQFIAPAARPAAAYAVGPLVLLASYEPCTPGLREPLIRYLRQDPAGGVATDVMLQRESVSP
jgi:hypothetical protein